MLLNNIILNELLEMLINIGLYAHTESAKRLYFFNFLVWDYTAVAIKEFISWLFNAIFPIIVEFAAYDNGLKVITVVGWIGWSTSCFFHAL